MPTLTQAVGVLLLFECAMFKVGLSQESEQTTKNILRKVVAEEITDVEAKLDALTGKITSLQNELGITYNLGLSRSNAATSCGGILYRRAHSPSGYYWIKIGGHPHRVYCEMTLSCGGVTGGWMRVAYLDMTNASHYCPGDLRQQTFSNKRVCTRNSDSAGCSSASFSSLSAQYSKVCGRAQAYHVTTMDAFRDSARGSGPTIDSTYVDGISITYERYPRKHIWTFAANFGDCNCGTPPSYVGNDYFCDTMPSYHAEMKNSLWDGEECGDHGCCTFNNPPWFYKQLPRPTTSSIEMRVCRDQERSDEDVRLEQIEIYVQ